MISKRQKFLTLVLENIHDPHNVSAIFRSAEAAGIDKIFLVYNTTKFPKIGKTSSASAKKWITTEKFENVKDCFDELRKNKFHIYSTHMSENKKKDLNLYDLDLTKKVAIVLGNEHSGVSDEVKELSDKNFLIPMFGLIQSLNVSVAAAVCVYEALRQRLQKGMYEKSGYTKTELKEKLTDYLNR
ncbi:MAG: RNA methyltransferase [Ignavibacteria bacterium]